MIKGRDAMIKVENDIEVMIHVVEFSNCDLA